MSQGFDGGSFEGENQNEAPFDAFAMDDVDPDHVGSGGGDRLPEGGYRLSITAVTLKNERGSCEIEAEVVADKDGKFIGKKHKEFLSWPKSDYSEVRNRICKEQLLAWCYAAKTTSPEEIKARQQARQGFSSAWLESMVGRPVLGVVKHDAYQNAAGVDKTSANIEGRVMAVDNPKGKGIPGWVDAGPASTATSAPTTTAAAPAAAPFDDLV